MGLHLLLHVLVADCNHGARASVWVRVELRLLAGRLRLPRGIANEHDVVLVDTCVVGAAVGALFVAPSQAGSTSVILLAHGESTHVLVVWAKVEERVSVGFLLVCRCGDVASVGARGAQTYNAALIGGTLLLAIPDK